MTSHQQQEETAATAFADDAMAKVMHTAEPAPADVLEARIDEVMDFMRFSIKRDTPFRGTVLFKFKDASSANQSTYLVTVGDNKEVSTMKNSDLSTTKVTCEISMTKSDFLYIYSGQASNAELLRMFYSGRVSISGYAFRTASNFAACFDFSSDMWTNFYACRDTRQSQDHSRTTRALDEVNNVGSPSRDFWFYYCRAILERYNISKLQRITWETSLASMFGDQFILDNVRRSVQSRRGSAGHQTPHKHHIGGVVAGLVGANAPHAHVASELSHFFQPRMKRRNTIATVRSVHKSSGAAELFDFFDEEYLDAVKHSAKQRLQRSQQKNRVDLADAGMDQLDRLLRAFGKSGHSNEQCKTKVRYIPAPELFLREFRTQATELMYTIQEKALGRKRVERIPPPDMSWLLSPDSSMMVISGSHSTSKSATATMQELVVIDRSLVQRRGSKRDFHVPKQKIMAKFASLSRDLANHSVPLSLDDHIIFSDYA